MLGAAHAQSGSHLFIADEARVHRAVFDVGETIYVDAMGLRPSATYDIELTEAESKSKPELLARLMSDRHGNLPPTAVLPHFGLIPHRGPHRRFRLHDEAELDLGGRAFSLRAIPTKSESKGSSEARFAITGASRNPQVFPCDSGGRLVTGFVRGEADILVGLRNFLPGCLRIFAVTRQFGWRPGDPLEPARDASSQPVSLTVRIDREGLTTVRLLSREHVREGSYQFVARHSRPAGTTLTTIVFWPGTSSRIAESPLWWYDCPASFSVGRRTASCWLRKSPAGRWPTVPILN